MPLRRTPPTTPAGQEDSDLDMPTAVVDLDPNITKRKRKFDQVDDLNVIMSEMKNLFTKFEKEQNDKYNALHASMIDIRELNASIKTSCEFVNGKYDDLLKEFNKLTSERKENLAYIQILEEKVENLERAQRSSCLELRNIPITLKETKEDLSKIVIDTGNSLNVSINTSDIRDVYRLNTKNEINKPIIVNFTTVITKEKVIKSIKSYNRTNKNNKFSTAKLYINGPDVPVYISEHLTSRAKRLFFLARDFSKTNGYSFCWTAHGKVFIRKKEGQTAHCINNESDLKSLKVED